MPKQSMIQRADHFEQQCAYLEDRVEHLEEEIKNLRPLMTWALNHVIRPLLNCEWCKARRVSDLSEPLRHKPDCLYDRATKFAEGE